MLVTSIRTSVEGRLTWKSLEFIFKVYTDASKVRNSVGKRVITPRAVADIADLLFLDPW